MIAFQQSKTQSRFLTAPTAGEGQFINRELSLLAFNERVLSLAIDPSVPLLESFAMFVLFQVTLTNFLRYVSRA